MFGFFIWQIQKKKRAFLLCIYLKREEKEMADNKKLATAILEKVGGKENIEFLVHCMTRLRFNFKDKGLVDQKEIEEIPGVLGTMIQNGQFQIIIGETVPDVYEEICKLAGIAQEKAIDENLDVEQSKKKFGFGTIFEVFSGVFAPVVTAFAGAGVLKGLLTLCTNYGWMATDTGLYLILNAAADSVFYFLPFILAYTSAKKFKTNEVMALIIAGIYMYPSILNNAGTQASLFGFNFYLVKYSASVLPIIISVWFMALIIAGIYMYPSILNNAGTQASLFGFNFYLVKYSASVLPIIISVWLMSYVYRWLSKNSPAFLRVVLVPVGTLLVLAPLSLIVIGPIGYNIGIYLGQFFKWLFESAPWLGGLIAGLTRPLVVFVGAHMMITPVLINNIETLGYDMIGPVFCVATMATAGMCFGAFLRAKKENNKTAIFSSFVSAFIGITEPALYGVAFRFKKPLIALMIGGGISGAFVAMFGAKAISFAMPSIISLPVYAGSISTMLIGLLIAFILTAVLTYFLGFDENKE